MSNDTGAFPFGLFGLPGMTGSPNASAGFAQPIAQGLTSGVDLMKKMLGQMPGGSAIPGFLLPTVDVEELDKRIGDLRAAESWLDVNLKMLRATIQGLEVQRNTIAAIKSFGAMGAPAAPAASPAVGGLPPGWPMSPTPADAPEPVAAVAPVEAPPPAKPRAPRAPRAEPTAAPPSASAASSPDMLASLAANNWLGYMQDQFSKVAKVALAKPSTKAAVPAPAKASAPVGRKAAKKGARKRRASAPKA